MPHRRQHDVYSKRYRCLGCRERKELSDSSLLKYGVVFHGSVVSSILLFTRCCDKTSPIPLMFIHSPLLTLTDVEHLLIVSFVFLSLDSLMSHPVNFNILLDAAL